MSDHLRPLWDFDDLDTTEKRFRSQLALESSEGRAEVLTQLARVEGLRGGFEEGERLIEEAVAIAGASEVAWARIDLERGRLRRSSGNMEAALPLFESAFATSLEAGELFIAVDAAHMAALAAPNRDGFVAWTHRGIELAESGDASATYWLGPLLNNLGWELYESDEYSTPSSGRSASASGILRTAPRSRLPAMRSPRRCAPRGGRRRPCRFSSTPSRLPRSWTWIPRLRTANALRACACWQAQNKTRSGRTCPAPTVGCCRVSASASARASRARSRAPR